MQPSLAHGIACWSPHEELLLPHEAWPLSWHVPSRLLRSAELSRCAGSCPHGQPHTNGSLSISVPWSLFFLRSMRLSVSRVFRSRRGTWRAMASSQNTKWYLASWLHPWVPTRWSPSDAWCWALSSKVFSSSSNPFSLRSQASGPTFFSQETLSCNLYTAWA